MNRKAGHPREGRRRPKGGGGDGRELRIVARNKKASHRYHFIETFEAGLSLTGNEVKSLREGRVSLDESYARLVAGSRGGEFHLVGCHIAPYGKTGFDQPEPLRRRKLLLKRSEIRRVASRVLERGLTVVPTMVYFKGPWAKVELALARGKGHADKRATLKKREQERHMARAKGWRGRSGKSAR